MSRAAPLPSAAPAAPTPGAGRLASVIGLIARLSTAVAAIALMTMVLAVVADVAMANLFKRPMSGTFDLVETALVVLVFMGFPATFLRSGHIAVDVVDHVVSPAAVARLKLLAAAVTLLFLLFLAWQMLAPALDALKFGERKQELGLPLWLLWLPMIVGIVLSAVALAAVVHAALKPPPAR